MKKESKTVEPKVEVKLSEKELRIIEQNKRPIADLVKQLNGYQPINTRVLMLPVNPQSESKIILPEGVQNTGWTKDTQLFARTIIGLCPTINDRHGQNIKIGDKALPVKGGIEFNINGLIVEEFSLHELGGYFSK